MRKLLNTIHILARIFVYLSVIGVLLLYFFKPGILEAVQKIVPSANTGAWLAEVTALAIAAVLFAVSELAYKSLLDNEYRVLLSSSVLKPAFDPMISATSASPERLRASLTLMRVCAM